MVPPSAQCAARVVTDIGLVPRRRGAGQRPLGVTLLPERFAGRRSGRVPVRCDAGADGPVRRGPTPPHRAGPACAQRVPGRMRTAAAVAGAACRATDPAIPSLMYAPAAPTVASTTMAAGLSMLHTSASGRPMVRPRSPRIRRSRGSPRHPGWRRPPPQPGYRYAGTAHRPDRPAARGRRYCACRRRWSSRRRVGVPPCRPRAGTGAGTPSTTLVSPATGGSASLAATRSRRRPGSSSPSISCLGVMGTVRSARIVPAGWRRQPGAAPRTTRGRRPRAP